MQDLTPATEYFIQMKGATIDATAPATNPNFGTITAYNSAGRYEFAAISTVPDATTIIYILAATTNIFDPAGRIQIVRVPNYTDVTIVAPLTAQAWNGTTGGVLALWVTGTLTLNSDIDVSGMGFRGGQVSTLNTSCSSATWATNNLQWDGKGEGIAENTNNRARSKLANGGGGLVRLTMPLPPAMTIYNDGGISSRNSSNSDFALQGNAYFCAEALGLGGAIFDNLNLLPVEISRFGAERSGKKETRIFWTTLSERNNAGFEVQKSRDSINFTTFSAIFGKSGDSFSTRNYEVFDQEPHYGANYYRLKQIDKDGTVTFSKIVVVYFKDINIANGATLFPSPTSQNHLYLRIERADATMSVVCFDLAGCPMDTAIEKSNTNEYHIQFGQQLPQGMYLFKIKVGTDEYLEKVVIQ